jgi:hypothetical protein
LHLSMIPFFICTWNFCSTYKWLTRVRWGHIQMTRYKWLIFITVGGSAQYTCVGPTFIMVRDHHRPVQICAHLYPFLGPIHMCNDYNSFSPLPERPSPLFFFLSPTRAPPPPCHHRGCLPVLRRFLHIFTHSHGVEVSYFIPVDVQLPF